MKKGYFYVDFIRVISAFLVILLHTTGLHLAKWGTTPYNVWMTENVYDSFTRMSVPLFVMLSGALLLGKDESYKDFFKKRLSKLLIPFIVWISVYLGWRTIILREHMSVNGMIKTVLQGPVYYHLWYLYMIIGLYLITPVIRKFTKNAASKDLSYFSFLWIFFISVLPTSLLILKYRFNISIEIGITIPLLAGHVGYYVLGYHLHQQDLKKPNIKYYWFGLILAWLSTTYGTLYFTSMRSSFSDLFYSYFSPTVLLEAVCAFSLLIYYGKILEEKISDGVRFSFSILGNASFGVYLVHPMVLDVLLRNRLFFPASSLNTNPGLSIPSASIIVMVISYLVVLVLSELPIINYSVASSSIRSRAQVRKLKINRSLDI